MAALLVVANVAAFAADPEPDYDAKVSVTNLTEGDAAHFYKIVEWVGEADGNVKGWKVVSPFNFDLNAVLVGTPASEGVAAVAATGITAELANTLAATAGKTEAGSDTVGDDGIAELDVSTLGAGIYMVLITPANTDVVYNPVFVSSDYDVNANPDTDTWAISELASYSNNAAAKKSTTTLNKEASTQESAPDDVKWITTAIGDTVHFTVTTTIPGFGPAFIDPFFKMTDKLTDLTLVTGSVKVTSPAEAKAAAHIVEGTDQYSIDWNETAGKAIADIVATLPGNPLASIKGVGPVYSAGIIAEIGDVHRFSNQAALAKYAGLAWSRHQSGEFDADQTSLILSGNHYLRYYLIEAVNKDRLYDPDYAAFYNQKYTETRITPHKRALVLTARKFVRLVYALLRDNKFYTPPSV